MELSAVGEFGLIARFARRVPRRGRGVVRGIGDDAAVLSPSPKHRLLVTTDLLIEGVHFRRDWLDCRAIGRRAMIVNLSDIAAMGGRPRFAVVSVGLPRTFKVHKAEALFEGIQSVAGAQNVALVGGDTNASPRLVVNIALIGEVVGKGIGREGARVSDRIFVTGSLGEGAMEWAALRAGKRKGGREPPIRLPVGRWLASRRAARAMIDLSDGLLADLKHLLEASGVGAKIEVDRLPGKAPRLLRLTGGEDYELLFTASPRVKIPSKIAGVRVTQIGTIGPQSWGIRLEDSAGRRVPLPSRLGFRHF